MIFESVITCPYCVTANAEAMPTDALSRSFLLHLLTSGPVQVFGRRRRRSNHALR